MLEIVYLFKNRAINLWSVVTMGTTSIHFQNSFAYQLKSHVIIETYLIFLFMQKNYQEEIRIQNRTSCRNHTHVAKVTLEKHLKQRNRT